MTTGPDPSGAPARDSTGRALVRWSATAVVLALLVAATAAFLVDRGRVEQSDGVSFAVAGPEGSTPAASPEASSPTPTPEGSATSEAHTPVSPSPAATTVAATPTAADPTSTPEVSPTAAPTEAPPRLALSSSTVGIGETFAVRVHAPEAGSGSIVAQGLSYPLLAEGDGSFLAVIGVPLNAAIGPSELTLTIRDDFGTMLEEQRVPFEVAAVERPIDYLELTEEQGAVLTPEAAVLEAQLRTEQFLAFDRPRRWEGLFRVPALGIETTAFGQGRSINGGPVGGLHSGTDIANLAGTPIQASAAGRVSWVGEMPIRGNTVIIDHGAGVKTGYHHLQAFLVEVDQEVAGGTVIGEMGSTGLSTGPHLHWELSIYGVNVDPKTWTTVDFAGGASAETGAAADDGAAPN